MPACMQQCTSSPQAATLTDGVLVNEGPHELGGGHVPPLLHRHVPLFHVKVPAELRGQGKAQEASEGEAVAASTGEVMN